MKASRNCPRRRLDTSSPALKLAALAALMAASWLVAFTTAVVIIGAVFKVLG